MPGTSNNQKHGSAPETPKQYHGATADLVGGKDNPDYCGNFDTCENRGDLERIGEASLSKKDYHYLADSATSGAHMRSRCSRKTALRLAALQEEAKPREFGSKLSINLSQVSNLS